MSLTPNMHRVLLQAIDEGVAHGIRRYYKYKDTSPTEPDIMELRDTIADSVVNSVYEWFNSPEPEFIFDKEADKMHGIGHRLG